MRIQIIEIDVARGDGGMGEEDVGIAYITSIQSCQRMSPSPLMSTSANNCCVVCCWVAKKPPRENFESPTTVHTKSSCSSVSSTPMVWRKNSENSSLSRWPVGGGVVWVCVCVIFLTVRNFVRVRRIKY